MKRALVALGLTIAAASTGAAGTTTVAVPEMDGGVALAAGAVVLGLAAIVYEKFFRR